MFQILRSLSKTGRLYPEGSSVRNKQDESTIKAYLLIAELFTTRIR
jgi:hypothetical protein